MFPNYDAVATRLKQLLTDQRNGMPYVSLQVKYQTKGNDPRAKGPSKDVIKNGAAKEKTVV